MSFKYTTARILEILGGSVECIGEFDGAVVGISSLQEARGGDLSFLGNLKYRADVDRSQASVLLLPHDCDVAPREGQLQIKLKNPSFGLALICRDIENYLSPRPAAGIHPSAVIEAGAIVSPDASIGAFCYVGAGAEVGAAVLANHVSIGRSAKILDEAYLFPHVVVADYCQIGRRNRIQSGAVVGSDGYGYEYYESSHQRVPQVGHVITADDVDVGANTTIDRARFGVTSVGAGTKIDNQVQIAHNVRIGKNCLIVAQVGISGSTHLGDGVVVGGQAGLVGHITVGSGAMIAGGAVVASSLAPKSKVRGYPAQPMMLFNRIAVLQRKLPELFKRFDQLEKNVESSNFSGTSD